MLLLQLRREPLAEIFAHFIFPDLNAGTEAEFEEAQRSELPLQVRFQLRFGDPRAQELLLVPRRRGKLALDFFPQRFHGIGFGWGIEARIRFNTDQSLLYQALGGLALGSGAEVEWRAVQERGEPDLAQKFALRNHPISHYYRDPVDNLGTACAQGEEKAKKPDDLGTACAQSEENA